MYCKKHLMSKKKQSRKKSGKYAIVHIFKVK